MNTFLMWLGGLLIAIFALLFAGPHFVDWNSYRGVFEEEATRVMGRRVRVGGNVNVRLLPAPYVLFEDLRIADTTGIAGAPLFKADSFKMWLSVPPLLKGAFEANKIELERPVLALAVNDSGAGNWRTLLDVKALPFVPSGVKLQSVSIVEGTLSYSLENGGELVRVEKVTGELTAQALAGPYTYKGTAAVGTVGGNVRLATTEADKNGTFRLTAHVTPVRAKGDHKFDGQVSGLWDTPLITGELISRFGIEAARSADDSREPLVAEARSQLKADGRTLKLDGLTVSFEDFAQPQLVTGGLTAVWGRRNTVQLDLQSRWLDIDLLANGALAEQSSEESVSQTAAKPAVPLPTARSLVAGLLDAFPGKTDVTARLEVEQINLGAERVAGLVIAMERNAGVLELRTLKAVLPGGARLDFAGRVESVEGQTVFDGDLFLGGVSAARVIRWGLGSAEANSLITDGPFSVAGRMQLGSDKVVLKSAVAEFSGVPIEGSLIWEDGERRNIEISAEGYELDTRWFGLGDLELPALSKLLSSTDAQSKSEGFQGVLGWLSADGGAFRIDLKAGRLVDGKTLLREVDASVRMKGKTIDIDRLQMTTIEGLKTNLTGRIEDRDGAPQGDVTYLVDAPDRQAAVRLAEVWVGESMADTERSRMAGLTPLRVAGEIQLGRRLPTSADITFDGDAAGGRINGQARLDGGVEAWLDNPVDLTARAQSGDIEALLTGLAAGKPAASAGANPGNVLVKAVGTPRKGLATLVTAFGETLEMVFEGTSSVTGDRVDTMTGEIRLKTRDAMGMARLAGLDIPSSLEQVDYNGLADISWTPTALTFTPRDANIAGSRVGGRLTIATADGSRHRIEGELVTDRASLPRILAATLSKTPALQERVVAEAPAGLATADDAAPAPAAPNTIAPVFSERAFDLAGLDNIDASLTLKAGTLALTDDLSLTQATAAIQASGSQVKVELRKATTMSGVMAGHLMLEQQPAGASVTGRITMTGIDISKAAAASTAGNRRPLGRGQGDLEIEFKGRGLTPLGAIAVMSGNGKLRLRHASLTGLSPEGVRLSAEAALAAETPDPETLKNELLAADENGSVEFGDSEVALEIVDGAIRVGALENEAPDSGRTRLTLTVDIRTLTVDRDWRVLAADPSAGRPWPPVAVTRFGPMAALDRAEPQVLAGALERELTVRKMERNVNELERLRLLDEEAAARQRERIRQLELESQRIESERAAAAAAAAAQGAGNAGDAPRQPTIPPGSGNLDGSGLPPPSPDGVISQDLAPIPQDSGANAAAQYQDSAAQQVAPRPARKTRPAKKPKQNTFPSSIFGGD